MNFASNAVSGNAIEIWRWWMAGLRESVPASLHRKMRNQSVQFECLVEHERIINVKLRRDGRIVWASQNDESLVSNGETFLQSLRMPRGNNLKAALMLKPADVLTKEFYLPEAAMENIYEVLAFEMDRQTPFATEEVYYGYKIINHDRIAKRVRVRLFLIPKKNLEEIFADLDRLGIRAAVATCMRDGESETVLSFDDAEPTRASTGRRLLHALTAGFVIVLAVAVVITPLILKQQNLDELQTEIGKLRKELSESSKFRIDRRQYANQVAYVVQAQASRPSAIVVLRELAEKTSSDTVFSQIVLNASGLRLFGKSSNVSAAFDELDKSDHFRGGSIKLNTQTGSNNGTERFEMSLGLTSRD